MRVFVCVFVVRICVVTAQYIISEGLPIRDMLQHAKQCVYKNTKEKNTEREEMKPSQSAHPIHNGCLCDCKRGGGEFVSDLSQHKPVQYASILYSILQLQLNIENEIQNLKTKMTFHDENGIKTHNTQKK